MRRRIMRQRTGNRRRCKGTRGLSGLCTGSELTVLFARWERLRRWHATEVLLFLFLKKEVTTSGTSCYRVKMYSGWAPDEGKGASERSTKVISKEDLIR